MASSRANRALRPAPHGTRAGLPLTGEPSPSIFTERLSPINTRCNMWAMDCLAATSSQLEITFVGTDMTMTDVSPIVTGLTGASQLASAGSSMTVRAIRQG